MNKVYVCDSPFNMEDIGNLTEEELETLRGEIQGFIVDEVTKSCPRWSAFDWLMFFLNSKKVPTITVIEAWNKFTGDTK